MDDAFRNDPKVQWILEDVNRVVLACDRGTRRMVIYPVRGCRVLNVVALCQVSEAPYLATIGRYTSISSLQELMIVLKGANYDSIVSNEDVLEAFKDFNDKYTHLFKIAQPGSIRAWPLLNVPPVPTWVKGNTVLVGDAAHPMWPCGSTLLDLRSRE